MDTSKLYQVAINLIPGIGNLLARQLIAYCGTAEKVFSANTRKLMQIPGIGYHTATVIQQHATLRKAEAIIHQCRQDNIRILHFTDENYPYRLKQLYDAPDILYYRGEAGLNPQKSISIVGTRRVTSYGRDITERILRDLSKHDVTIVSGLAYGVDHLAHLEALKNGLNTIGVIAGGIHHIYPALHIKTAEKMYRKGGLLTEHEPDISPEAHYFPERNRIIAGLADAVIVVEAARKGGALITAEYANNYNREVFAVPGKIGQKYSEGCNHLIKCHKASIYTCVEDIEYLLNWDSEQEKAPQDPSGPEGLSLPEKKLLQVLQKNEDGLLVDELSWRTQIPISNIASHLLNLEFRGHIKALPGKKYRLSH